MKTLLAIAVGLLCMAAAPAVQAQCPGGVCPYQPTARYAPVAHWTYPGDIHIHLRNGHGFDATGMTLEQAKTEHDRLHNAARASGVVRATYSSQRARPQRVRLFGRRR